MRINNKAEIKHLFPNLQLILYIEDKNNALKGFVKESYNL